MCCGDGFGIGFAAADDKTGVGLNTIFRTGGLSGYSTFVPSVAGSRIDNRFYGEYTADSTLLTCSHTISFAGGQDCFNVFLSMAQGIALGDFADRAGLGRYAICIHPFMTGSRNNFLCKQDLAAFNTAALLTLRQTAFSTGGRYCRKDFLGVAQCRNLILDIAVATICVLTGIGGITFSFAGGCSYNRLIAVTQR